MVKKLLSIDSENTQRSAEVDFLTDLLYSWMYCDNADIQEHYKWYKSLVLNSNFVPLNIYDRYTERLQEIIPSLTEQDLQICCLMKLRIPHQNIADILCISSSSVSKRKQRLKERIIQATGIWTEGQTLEEWLLGV